MNRYGFKRANVNVAREKGAVSQVRINTVTIERKKFSKVYGVSGAVQLILSIFNYIYVSYPQICTADGKRKQVGRSSKETTFLLNKIINCFKYV